MGTRSLTKFVNVSNGKEHCIGAMYRQFDGYLSGHGAELKKFLSGKKIINGIVANDNIYSCFNGLGCLGASVIKHFKDGIGHIYLTTSDDNQEYNYKIWAEIPEGFEQPKGTIMVTVTNYKNEEIYSGPIDDMPTTEED